MFEDRKADVKKD